MRTRCHTIFSAIVFAAALSGCAGADGRYPSLAVRDAERPGSTIEVPPPLSVGPTAASMDTVFEALASAHQWHMLFEADQEGVRELIDASKGLGLESDARTQALVAFANLTSLHGQTAGVLATLDQLEAESAVKYHPLEDVRDAQARVAKILEQQDAVLDSLEGELVE